MKPAQAYLAIRIAMMSGLLLFGAVAWFLHQRPEWVPPTASLVERLTMMGRIIWGVAVALLVFLFMRHRRAESPVTLSTLSIVAWSVGEALAIFGAVHFFLTNVSTWYIAGLIGMSITFIAFRPPALR